MACASTHAHLQQFAACAIPLPLMLWCRPMKRDFLNLSGSPLCHRVAKQTCINVICAYNTCLKGLIIIQCLSTLAECLAWASVGSSGLLCCCNCEVCKSSWSHKGGVAALICPTRHSAISAAEHYTFKISDGISNTKPDQALTEQERTAVAGIPLIILHGHVQ